MTGPRVTDRRKKTKGKTRRCLGWDPITGGQCNTTIFIGEYDDFHLCHNCRRRANKEDDEGL